MTSIPAVWPAVVLALGTFRIVRLIGWDDFPPVARLRARIVGENRAHRGAAIYGGDLWYERPLLAKFVHCAWCVGFWASCVVYVAWLEEPRWTFYVLAPFALSAAVGLIAKNLDP